MSSTLLSPVHYSVQCTARLCPTLCDPMDYTVHGIPQARILARVALPFYRGSSQSRDRTRSPTVQEGSLRVEPPGKPKNTGMGSLSLLQQILLTQELNRGLLRCRWILYQLSYRGYSEEIFGMVYLNWEF